MHVCMAPSWNQNSAKILQVGANMAILKPFGKLPLTIFSGLGAIFRKNTEV